MNLISAIADRAEACGIVARYDRFGFILDLEYAHAENALDLPRFLSAPLNDFVHDAGGIWSHLNRNTHKLEGGFTPRFAFNQ